MRSNRLLSVLVAAVVVGAGCTGGSGASPSPSTASQAPSSAEPGSVAPSGPSEPVDLRFATYVWQPATVEATEQIVEEWNAANPNIQVEIVPIDVNSVQPSS